MNYLKNTLFIKIIIIINRTQPFSISKLDKISKTINLSHYLTLKTYSIV